MTYDKTSQKRGYFGEYGGQFVPEILVYALEQLEQTYEQARTDPQFTQELNYLLANYVGRPTPLYYAARLSDYLGGAKVYLKREDLCHTGAHKINNALAQVLLARRMGKKRIIAETGAGQHGVATATAAAMLGLECEIYMGAVDVERQALNVFRMELLGATVRSVTQGSKILKDAINEALRDWVANVNDTHYVLGTVAGPHPFPTMVREFQSVIGREAKQQIQLCEGRMPDIMVACVGGGSNAMGLFYPFLDEQSITMVGVEAGGFGIPSGMHAARFQGGRKGVFQGALSYVLQDADGQITETHSVSAGLDYASVGPEHCLLHDSKRCVYTSVTDDTALEAFSLMCRLEGIIPALESSHAIGYLMKNRPKKGQLVVVNMSGRGDKDVQVAKRELEKRSHHE